MSSDLVAVEGSIIISNLNNPVKLHAPPNSTEIIFAINAHRRSNVSSFDGLPTEQFCAPLTTFAQFFFPHIRKCLGFQTFSNEWKKRSSLRSLFRYLVSDVTTGWSVWVLSAIVKIITKIILKRIKEHFGSLIDREAGFHSGSTITDNINILRVIVKQFAGFRPPFHLPFSNFKEASNSINSKRLREEGYSGEIKSEIWRRKMSRKSSWNFKTEAEFSWFAFCHRYDLRSTRY